MKVAMDSVPEQGRIQELPLPRILLEIQNARFGGALTLSRDRVGKRFLFQDGAPVFAESNLASESLGVQLMDAGRIDRTAFNRTTAHIERTGCKEGAALLELGILQPKELFVALKDQVRIRLLECFGWPHGEFFLDESAVTGADAQPFRLDTMVVVQEGLETHWSGERIFSDLSPHMDRYPSGGPSLAALACRLRSDDAVQAFLEALDGTRNLWKVVQMARTPRALAAAWVLDAVGALVYSDAPTHIEDSAGAFERELEIVVEGPRPETLPRVETPGRARPAPAAKSPASSGIDELRREIAAATAEAARHEDAAAGGSAAKGPSAAVEALRREISGKHAQLEAAERPDHYQLLGLEPTADSAAIRRAYLQAAKTYHPDALARLGLEPELRAQANRVFAEIGKAHAVLSDMTARRAYDSTLATHSTDLDADRLAQAETLYRKADILLRQGNFRGALEFLAPCVELWPEECAYQSGLGWALYKKSPAEPERAREHLERAARLDPDDGVNLFRLSVVLRELGEEQASAAAAARAEQVSG